MGVSIGCLGAMGRDRGAKLVEYEMGFRNWRRSGGLNKGGGDESGAEAGEGYKEKVACMLG